MRFTLIKDIKQDPFMRLVLSFLLLFIFIYLGSDLFVKHSSFGIFPLQISNTLYGDTEQFLDAISASLFLEFWHTEIFFCMMILFTLSTVYLRVSKASKGAIILVHVMMISAFLSLLTLFLAYYGSNFFVNFYVIFNFIWHIGAVGISLDSFKRLYFA